MLKIYFLLFSACQILVLKNLKEIDKANKSRPRSFSLINKQAHEISVDTKMKSGIGRKLKPI